MEQSEENIVIRLILGSMKETRGHEWYSPDCPISRALIACRYQKGARPNPVIVPKDVQNFVDQGIKIEYRGRRSKTLDKIGATKTDE